jgi:hypothetical protein
LGSACETISPRRPEPSGAASTGGVQLGAPILLQIGGRIHQAIVCQIKRLSLLGGGRSVCRVEGKKGQAIELADGRFEVHVCVGEELIGEPQLFEHFGLVQHTFSHAQFLLCAGRDAEKQ